MPFSEVPDEVHEDAAGSRPHTLVDGVGIRASGCASPCRTSFTVFTSSAPVHDRVVARRQFLNDLDEFIREALAGLVLPIRALSCTPTHLRHAGGSRFRTAR